MVITFAELVQRWPSKTEEDILRMAIAGVLPLAIWYEGATKGHTKVNARNGGLLAMLPPAMAGTLLTKGKAEALKLTTEAGVEFMPAQYFYPSGDKFPSVQTVFEPATGTLITKTEESKAYPIRLPIKKTEIIIPLRAVEQLEAKYPELYAGSSKADAELNPSERKSLAKMVFAMAVGGYGYDPNDKKSPITEQIVADVAAQDMTIHPDTVRKWLKEGARLKKDSR